MKRWKALLTGALIGCMAWTGVQAEERLCVTAENCAALLSADGQEIVAPGKYDDVYCVMDGERYALGVQTENGMRYALCDAAGELLTDAGYSMLSASMDVILFRQNGLYGAMTPDGQMLLPAAYTQLVAAGDGRFLATETDPFDDDADEILLVTVEDGARSTGVRTAMRLQAISDERMPYRDPASERCGYLDEQGNVAIVPQYETAGAFENGAAQAASGGALGVIGTDGAWRIPPEYDYLEIGEGTIAALADRRIFVVYESSSCLERFRVEGSGLEAALVGRYPVLLEGEIMSVFTPEGDTLLQTAADAVLQPGADGQLILSDGQWGASCASVIGADGARSGRTDQHLLPLDSDRYAFIRMNAATYVSDELNEIRYSCDYESLRFGMMDSAGHEILPAEFQEIRALGSRRYLTVAEDGLRVVDDEGGVLWECLTASEN